MSVRCDSALQGYIKNHQWDLAEKLLEKSGNAYVSNGHHAIDDQSGTHFDITLVCYAILNADLRSDFTNLSVEQKSLITKIIAHLERLYKESEGAFSKASSLAGLSTRATDLLERVFGGHKTPLAKVNAIVRSKLALPQTLSTGNYGTLQHLPSSIV